MTSRPHLSFALVLTLLALSQVAAQCGRAVDNTGGCSVDGDCPAFFTCQVGTGFCLCQNDNACDGEEFCNDEGRCQARTGCNSNADCKSAERPHDICDVTTGECVTLSASTLQCVLDSHCPFGSVCEQNICQQGCRQNGDCPLGQPCLGGQCDATPGSCNDDLYCEFGEMCNQVTNRCVAHADANVLCQWCRPQTSILDPEPCGGNSCLLDSSIPPAECSEDAHCTQYGEGSYCYSQPCLADTDCGPGDTCVGGGLFTPGTCSKKYCQRTFCGSDTCDDETNPCPKGYSCYRLITVTGQPCTLANDTCQGERKCQAGGENNVTGYCSCIQDSDCPAGLVCDNPGPNGVCLQGSVCGPSSGLLCEDVR